MGGGRDPERLLSVFTVFCGGAIVAIPIIDIIQNIGHSAFNLQFFLIRFYLVLIGCLLCTASLIKSDLLYHYFGFLKYAFGCGCLLIFAGALVIGMVSPFGLAMGIVAMVNGALHLTLHCWGKHQHSAVATTEPVTNYA